MAKRLLKVLILHFNSIKVRLELLDNFKNSVFDNKFQFHKGAIRTISSAALNYANESFQFHKGAIRTFCFYGVDL